MSNCIEGECKLCGGVVVWYDERPSYHKFIDCEKKEIGEKTPNWVIKDGYENKVYTIVCGLCEKTISTMKGANAITYTVCDDCENKKRD